MFLSVKERARQIAAGQFQPFQAPVNETGALQNVVGPNVVPSKVASKSPPSKSSSSKAKTSKTKVSSPAPTPAPAPAPAPPTPTKSAPPKASSKSTSSKSTSSSSKPGYTRPSSPKSSSSKTSAAKSTSPKISSPKLASKAPSPKSSSSKLSSKRSSSPKASSPKATPATPSKPVRPKPESRPSIGSFVEEPAEGDSEVSALRAACLKQVTGITGLSGRKLAIVLKQTSSGEWYAALKDTGADKYLKMWMNRSKTYPTQVEALEAYLVFVKKMREDCRLFPMAQKTGTKK